MGVDVQPLDPERLERLIGVERAERFRAIAAAARSRLATRAVVNVNSTAAGGGVAEMLQTLLAYARGVGVDARWRVIEGDGRFFEITKRIHNHLYGTPGDGGPLGADQRRHYEGVLEPNTEKLLRSCGPDDVVVLHDPQTAGMAPALGRAGIPVVWRCHVGIDEQNVHSEEAWAFLRPYLENVDIFVFSRARFAPPWVPGERLAVIPPSIDPFSAKNEHLDEDRVRAILRYVGLLDGGGKRGGEPRPAGGFHRRDGSSGGFSCRVDLLGTGAPPPEDATVLLQASRWDSMKDMPGVMRAFAQHLADVDHLHVVLAGPEVSGVSDDPEAGQVLRACLDLWRDVPPRVQRRLHLASVPMADPDQAATIVNALQRHAAVVAQKSLAEGFGLTVVEAMWKARPVVGSAVGGIVDQIVGGETGFLVDPADDLEQFAGAVRRLVDDPDRADRMGAHGRARVSEQFLGDRHLAQWADVFVRLDELSG
jgi:trehalose synthase